MKKPSVRIGVWASAGLLVSTAWGFYFASVDKNIPIEPATYAVANLTQPILAVMRSLKPLAPISLGWLVAANAASYALLGWTFEMIRQRYRSLHLAS